MTAGRGTGPDLPEGAFVVDPVFGRVVVVPERILRKIERDHGHAYKPRRADILDVVRSPTTTMPGNTGDRHCYARDAADLTRWLFVVVDYDQGRVGQVLTAFPRRRLPRR